jgi:hypothetical protein
MSTPGFHLKKEKKSEKKAIAGNFSDTKEKSRNFRQKRHFLEIPYRDAGETVDGFLYLAGDIEFSSFLPLKELPEGSLTKHDLPVSLRLVMYLEIFFINKYFDPV